MIGGAGCNSVRASITVRFVGVRQPKQRTCEPFVIGLEDARRLRKAQHERRVAHVLARRAPVNERRGCGIFVAHPRRKDVDERDGNGAGRTSRSARWPQRRSLQPLRSGRWRPPRSAARRPRFASARASAASNRPIAASSAASENTSASASVVPRLSNNLTVVRAQSSKNTVSPSPCRRSSKTQTPGCAVSGCASSVARRCPARAQEQGPRRSPDRRRSICACEGGAAGHAQRGRQRCAEPAGGRLRRRARRADRLEPAGPVLFRRHASEDAVLHDFHRMHRLPADRRRRSPGRRA